VYPILKCTNTQVSNPFIDINTQVFDRNSTSIDDSRIIAPRADRSLLRRSAFSARGRSRKANGHSIQDRQQQATEKRRSVSQRKPSTPNSIKSNKTNDSWDKSQGVSLFDQPVNLSEWIDLGSASLESDDSQRGILSRVHDAESQLRSQIDNDNSLKEEEEEEEEEEEDEVDHKLSEAIVTNDPVTVTKQPDLTATITKAKPESMKRPGIIRSETEAPTIPLSKVNPSIMTKPEKRSSWLGGLFNDKKGERKQLSTKKPNNNTVITTNTNSPLSGFASLFTRSLSMKSSQLSTVSKSNSKNSAKSKPNKVNTNQAQSLPITTTITTITTNDNTTTTTSTDTKKKRSSRLEIPPPSERTFFNSNRLPLHVERAIYRLSHMKLADPRRPLRQQVLISNLMFWYLSIQQNDFQQVNTEQRVEADSPPVPDTQQKKGNKMSRLIHSAKKRRNEVAQFVQAYPLTQHETTIATTITSSRPSLKQSNVQFSLPPIPNHHPMIKDDIEDNVPLSHYRS
jgi:hypothetical protein